MRKLVLTNRAKFNIKSLLEYLELSWSVKVREKQADNLLKTMRMLQGNPEMFPKSDHNLKIRKCVISKQSILYYSFNQNSVVIISLFDTRQDPNKINKIN